MIVFYVGQAKFNLIIMLVDPIIDIRDIRKSVLSVTPYHGLCMQTFSFANRLARCESRKTHNSQLIDQNPLSYCTQAVLLQLKIMILLSP